MMAPMRRVLIPQLVWKGYCSVLSVSYTHLDVYKRQGLMVAAVVKVVIPVLVVYIFLQNYIIKGMTAGAVKGLSLIHI